MICFVMVILFLKLFFLINETKIAAYKLANRTRSLEKGTSRSLKIKNKLADLQLNKD